ncbi:MAG: hydrolase 1, exosortase A system-associated [Steroidobacteraceae bacterium]
MSSVIQPAAPSTSASRESAIVFRCEGDDLVAIVHRPAAASRSVGVLVVVGGPQYRAGSHRQFVLMARRLAAEGYAALRFDYRGMGDSSGSRRTFESIDDDIRAAIDAFFAAELALRAVVVLGLCDAASAALMYCKSDARLAGLVLINPWVRTESGAARAIVRHYYWRRLTERSLWRKIGSGALEPRTVVRDFVTLVRRAWWSGESGPDPKRTGTRNFLDRMAEGIGAFEKPILLILSGQDLTAAEFEDYRGGSSLWRRCLSSPRVREVRLSDADHTFSSRESLAKASLCVIDWLGGIGGTPG